MIFRFFKKEFWIMLFATGLACSLNLLLVLSKITEVSPKFKETMNTFNSIPFSALMILALIVAPLLEELTFRGVFFGLPRYVIKLVTGYQHIGITIFLAFFSAILFGVYHGNIVQGIYAFLMGLAMCYTYDCCGGIFWSMSFHFFANFFSIFAGTLANRSGTLLKLIFTAVGFCLSLVGAWGLKGIYLQRHFVPAEEKTDEGYADGQSGEQNT